MARSKRLVITKLMIERGLCQTEEVARALIESGEVLVSGIPASNPQSEVSKDVKVELRSKPLRGDYVSRAALKLKEGLEKFSISVADKVCADLGCSTGGFTQVLLQAGAKKVYAVDTAYGELDYSLRSDSRVEVHERQNACALTGFDQKVDFISIDISLVSLRKVLSSLGTWMSDEASVLALFKPQYEVQDADHLQDGVIKSDQIRKDLLAEFESWLTTNDWVQSGPLESPIQGASGNIEYLYLLRKRAS